MVPSDRAHPVQTLYIDWRFPALLGAFCLIMLVAGLIMGLDSSMGVSFAGTGGVGLVGCAILARWPMVVLETDHIRIRRHHFAYRDIEWVESGTRMIRITPGQGPREQSFLRIKLMDKPEPQVIPIALLYGGADDLKQRLDARCAQARP